MARAGASRGCKGFSIAELLISLSLLSFVALLAFALFHWSTRMMADTTVRQSSEAQIRVIEAHLKRDVELSDYWMMSTVPRRMNDTSRDAVAVGGLADWENDSHFDPFTGRPVWDRYLVYYATQEQFGRLIRQTVRPEGGDFKDPYGALSGNLSDLNPENNRHATFTRILSEDILEFEVNPMLANGAVEFNIGLRGRGTNKRGETQVITEENLEMSLVFELKNTWPRI